MSGQPELLGSYWTTAGPVEVHTGREWSLFDWADRCAEAARVGMRGLGLWHADLAHQLEHRDLGEIRQIFDDHGLERLEVEFCDAWFLDKGTPERSASDATRALLFDAAARLGAHHVKVGNIAGHACPPSKLADRFAELCEDAARQHDAPIMYELMPFDPNVGSLEEVIRLVEAAGAPNGGIALDFWHLGKLDVSAADLRGIPAGIPLYVELSDGEVENMPDPVEETTQFRKLPGDGEFDVRGYVAALREIGYDGPWGVEVLSRWLRALPMTEMFQRTVDTASAQLAHAAGGQEVSG